MPFPEFWFNWSYRIFSPGGFTEAGELMGPAMEVRVRGTLREGDGTSPETPKRFVVVIERGQLCLGRSADAQWVLLPIRGEGLFDGVYLGERP